MGRLVRGSPGRDLTNILVAQCINYVGAYLRMHSHIKTINLCNNFFFVRLVESKVIFTENSQIFSDTLEIVECEIIETVLENFNLNLRDLNIQEIT